MAEVAEDEARHIESIERAFRPNNPLPDRIERMQAFYAISKYFGIVCRYPEIFQTAIERVKELRRQEIAEAQNDDEQ